jgi:DNA-directed RNA polymerase specialized sigma24 family protein
MRLVRRLLGRDEAAFEEFLDAMYPALSRFALARLDGRPDAAEDVAQTTLYRAIGKLKTYSGRGVVAHVAVQVLPPRSLRLHQSPSKS